MRGKNFTFVFCLTVLILIFAVSCKSSESEPVQKEEVQDEQIQETGPETEVEEQEPEEVLENYTEKTSEDKEAPDKADDYELQLEDGEVVEFN